MRLGEIEPRAFQRDRPPRLDGLLPRPIQRRVMPAERGQQEQDGGVGSGWPMTSNRDGRSRDSDPFSDHAEVAFEINSAAMILITGRD